MRPFGERDKSRPYFKNTMKLKIIFPSVRNIHRAGEIYEPLILSYLAALTPSPWEVEAINAGKEPIEYSSPVDLVALSFMTSMAPEAYRIADLFKARGVKVVMGGHHASALPQEALEHADAVCIGEGDLVWPQILRDFEAGRLKKFYVGGPMMVNSLPAGDSYYIPERADLSRIPRPRREVLKSKYFFNSLVTTRGCPYNCAFCAATPFFGSQLRHRPVEDVVAEVKNFGSFWFMADDDIFADSGYRLELYEQLSRKKKFQQWHGTGSIAVVREPAGEEILKLAAKSGLVLAMVGLESINLETLRHTRAEGKLRKDEGVDFAWTKEAIGRIKAHGINVLAFFMFGFDDDTPQTFRRTLEFCDELNVFPLPLLYAPLPGSALWAEYKDRLYEGLTWDQWDTDTALYHHPTLSPREREEMIALFRRAAYSWRRIFRRLRGMPFGTKVFSLIMQAGFKHGFRKDWEKVQEKRFKGSKVVF